MPRGTGARGFLTDMNGLEGRAFGTAVMKALGIMTEPINDQVLFSFKGLLRPLLPGSAKTSDQLSFKYTDGTRYITVYTADALQREVLKILKDAALGAVQIWKGEVTSGDYHTATYKILEHVQRPLESIYWEKALTMIKAETNVVIPGCLAKFQPPMDDSKDKTGRVKHQVVIAKDEPFIHHISDMAMAAWEVLQPWPEARESVVRTLVVHGAQVKEDSAGSSIVKKEPEEWVLIDAETLV
jgi:hypothetical protein